MSLSLELDGVTAGHGGAAVLDGLTLTVGAGETLALLGRNGVGKSTLLETVMGHTVLAAGAIRLGGVPIERMPAHLRARAGLGYVPQAREVFRSLTAEENLAVAARPGGHSAGEVYALFPQLAARRHTPAGRLSGGEQQMLAIGRALMGGPKVLLLDEPLEGLAPMVVEAVFAALLGIRDRSGMTIVLVEQKAELALAYAGRLAVLDRGRIVHHGDAAAYRGRPEAVAALLGIGDGESG